MLVPNNGGKGGGTTALILYLKDEDGWALFPAIVNMLESKDARGRCWLNPMFLELFFRLLYNQTTHFYHTTRQIKLNI